jgi:small subunit ribosomal protein S20
MQLERDLLQEFFSHISTDAFDDLSPKGWTNPPLSSKISGRKRSCNQIFGDRTLATIKSAMKRNRQNIKRRAHNRIYRGRARTYIKQARLAIQEGDLENARTNTKLAVSALDKAAEKGILHKNNAARRKGKIMARLAALEKEQGK